MVVNGPVLASLSCTDISTIALSSRTAAWNTMYRSATTAWDLGDVGVGLMAWLNIIAILILQGPALKALTDYEAQKKQGLDPVFDPDKLNIKNADLWRDMLPERSKK